MSTAQLHDPVVLPVPYIGITYIGIPEWQGIGTDIGQQIAGALAGRETVDAALATAQADTARALTQAGYGR